MSRLLLRALVLASTGLVLLACGDSEVGSTAAGGASSVASTTSAGGAGGEGGAAQGGGGGAGAGSACAPLYVPPGLFTASDGPIQLVGDGLRVWYAGVGEGGRVGSLARTEPEETPNGTELVVPAFTKLRLRRAGDRTWSLWQRLDQDFVKIASLGEDALVEGVPANVDVPTGARFEALAERGGSYFLYALAPNGGVLTETPLNIAMLAAGPPVEIDQLVSGVHWGETSQHDALVWFRSDAGASSLWASVDGGAPMELLEGARPSSASLDRRVALSDEGVAVVIVDALDPSAEELVWFDWAGLELGRRPLEKLGTWSIVAAGQRLFRGATEVGADFRKAHYCFGTLDEDLCDEVVPPEAGQYFSYQDAARIDDGWVTALGLLDGGPAAPQFGFLCDP